MKSLIAAALVALFAFVIEILASSDIIKAIGLAIVGGTVVEYMFAVFSKQELDASVEALQQRSLLIAKKLRELK